MCVRVCVRWGGGCYTLFLIMGHSKKKKKKARKQLLGLDPGLSSDSPAGRCPQELRLWTGWCTGIWQSEAKAPEEPPLLINSHLLAVKGGRQLTGVSFRGLYPCDPVTLQRPPPPPCTLPRGLRVTSASSPQLEGLLAPLLRAELGTSRH